MFDFSGFGEVFGGVGTLLTTAGKGILDGAGEVSSWIETNPGSAKLLAGAGFGIAQHFDSKEAMEEARWYQEQQLKRQDEANAIVAPSGYTAQYPTIASGEGGLLTRGYKRQGGK